MPYLVLGAAAVVMLLIVGFSGEAALRVWVFVVTGGAISLGDLAVTGIFRLYRYHPGILVGHPDNYLGVLLAECLFVPSYYAFLSALPAPARRWVFGLSATIYPAVELIFLRLGVYSHHGWRITYTAVLFGAFGLAMAIAIDRLEQRGFRGYSNVYRGAFTGAAVYYSMNLWGLLPFGVLRLTSLRLHLVADSELDLVFSSLLLHALPYTLLGLTGTWYGYMRRPLVALLVAGGFSAYVWLLELLGVFSARPPWNPVVDGSLVALVHFALAHLEHQASTRLQGLR